MAKNVGNVLIRLCRHNCPLSLIQFEKVFVSYLFLFSENAAPIALLLGKEYSKKSILLGEEL